MADINKEDVKLLQSQRLDETPQGGGQMTSHEVVDGAVNNLFPDISRLDRVYGRVSMRKAFLAIQTSGRETYYGSHTIITQQASDPNVSMCFFTTKDWFDQRESARKRMESYLVKGPRAVMSLWANHYIGTSVLKFFNLPGFPIPEVGDVLVLVDTTGTGNEQYVRVIDVSSTVQTFQGNDSEHTPYDRQIITVTIGNRLQYDFAGVEIEWSWSMVTDPTAVYDTVAADASTYYGVANLVDPISQNSLQLRIDNVLQPLVPSAASETAVTDAHVGGIATPPLSTVTNNTTVTRNLTFAVSGPGSSVHIGEGVYPTSFTWNGGIQCTDNGKGDLVDSGSNIVGTIDYPTGTLTFNNAIGSGNAIITYVPATFPQRVSETGAIIIETNNRGYTYTFNCNPLPYRNTLKVEYLAAGKWYTLKDIGNGQIKNPLDDSIGSGVLNYDTGSVAITLGAMPDVGSKILFFWAKPADYYEFAGEYLDLRYKFTTQTEGIARNTFVMTWIGDGNGPGQNGEYAIVDDGNGVLCVGSWNAGNSDWDATTQEVGSIKYATGEIDTGIGSGQYTPKPSEVFTISYNYGAPFTEVFNAPARDSNNHIPLTLSNTPILPRTFKIEWHTDIQVYDPQSRFIADIDPTYIFRDDGNGYFDGDTDDGTPGWIKGTVDYNSGDVLFHPDRTSSFPHAKYEWVTTEWHHPGITESYIFKEIEYLPAASIFPPNGSVTCSYCTTDGSNADNYTINLTPAYIIREDSNLNLVIGSLKVIGPLNEYMMDIGDGKLYTSTNGVDGTRTEVGTINYSTKQFTITSDSIKLGTMHIIGAVGMAALDPAMSMVFRTPGAPVRPGSVYVRATVADGSLLEATSDFSGDFTGTGVFGHVDFNTGLCNIGFGEWVADDGTWNSAEWYTGAPSDGSGNIWRPFSIDAATITMNCVVTSYLPLDPDLLGLDPVRLPMDGKVPVFRDGYIIVIHNSQRTNTPHPLDSSDPLTTDIIYDTGRTNADLIEVYALPTAEQLEEGTQTCAKLVPELRFDSGTSQWVPNYEIDLDLGRVTFKTGFELPKDDSGTLQQIMVLNRIEDMCLCSDVQVTGHISVTNAITHDYPIEDTLVSAVLPSGDLQSRAYNEFEQATWDGEWRDYRPSDISEPLASYNFVDYPIFVTNKPSIKERWLILWKTPTTVQIIGENFGMLADNVNIDPAQASLANGNIEYPVGSGNWFVGVANNNFVGDANPYYWLMDIRGFGLGWQSGNCIRFNQDAANYPLWFVRTTLQAPPTEPVDHYSIQVRGDSS